jgi:hypothetical protein
MAFSGNFLANSFKVELLKGCHDFTLTTGDVFKVAMYTNSATFDQTTTTYTVTNEISGTGYTAGGQSLTNVTATNTGTTAFTDFGDAIFSTATITAFGALIYNTNPNTTSSAGLSNPVVCVLDFGGSRTSTAGDFTIVFPTANSSSAIIRIA